MYYVTNDSIEVEQENAESIFIDKDSKFYEYIKNAINSQTALLEIKRLIEDNQDNYDIDIYIKLQNELEEMLAYNLNLISERALFYRALQEKYLEMFPELVDNNVELWEQLERVDAQIKNQITVFKDYSTHDITSITFAKLDDVMNTLKSSSEFARTNFEQLQMLYENTVSHGVDDSKFESDMMESKMNAQHIQQTMIQDVDVSHQRTFAENNIRKYRRSQFSNAHKYMTKEELEISMNLKVDEEMRKHGIDRNSGFYNYIRDRLIAKYLLISDRNTAVSALGEDSEIVKKLNEIIIKNDMIVSTRSAHYSMLRNSGNGRPIEALKDRKGNTYLELIGNVDRNMITNAGNILNMILNRDVSGADSILQQMSDEADRTKKYDDEMIKESRKLGSVNNSTQRRFTKKNSEKFFSIKELVNKHKSELAKVAMITLTGVALGLSLNALGRDIDEASTVPVITPSPVVATTLEAPEVTQTPTPIIIKGINPVNTAEPIPEIKTNYQAGKLESTIEHMDDEMISFMVAAIKEGNSNIPYAYGAYVIDPYIENVDDRTFLKYAFKEMDSRIGNVKYGIDSHQLSFQMYEMMHTLMKHEVTEALQEKGYDVDMDQIVFYPVYNSNDSVNKYDVNLRVDSDETKCIVRSDQIKGTEMDKAIRSLLTLRRTMDVIALFDENRMMADATNSAYDAFETFVVHKDLSLKKMGKSMEVINERGKSADEYDER